MHFIVFKDTTENFVSNGHMNNSFWISVMYENPQNTMLRY